MSGDSLWGWLWVQGRADQGLPSRAQALTGGAPLGLGGWRAVNGPILADISTEMLSHSPHRASTACLLLPYHS